MRQCFLDAAVKVVFGLQEVERGCLVCHSLRHCFFRGDEGFSPYWLSCSHSPLQNGLPITVERVSVVVGGVCLAAMWMGNPECRFGDARPMRVPALPWVVVLLSPDRVALLKVGKYV
jgi:hypothetical protein